MEFTLNIFLLFKFIFVDSEEGKSNSIKLHSVLRRVLKRPYNVPSP